MRTTGPREGPGPTRGPSTREGAVSCRSSTEREKTGLASFSKENSAPAATPLKDLSPASPSFQPPAERSRPRYASFRFGGRDYSRRLFRVRRPCKTVRPGVKRDGATMSPGFGERGSKAMAGKTRKQQLEELLAD